MSDSPKWRWRLIDRPRLKVQFQVELRDLWIGIFWRQTEIAWHFYICLIPCLPLHITKAKVMIEGRQ